MPRKRKKPILGGILGDLPPSEEESKRDFVAAWDAKYPWQRVSLFELQEHLERMPINTLEILRYLQGVSLDHLRGLLALARVPENYWRRYEMLVFKPEWGLKFVRRRGRPRKARGAILKK